MPYREGDEGVYVDEWTYTGIPIVFDNGEHGWVWRAEHPQGGEKYFDRRGIACEMRFGEKGVRLFYKAVDFKTH